MTGRMAVTGSHLIAGQDSAEGDDGFHAVDPRSAEPGSTVFREAAAAEIQRAAAAAAAAAGPFGEWPGAKRAALLRTAADMLDAAAGQIVATAAAETGLDAARLTGELGRTTTQLRAFAGLAAEGSYAGAIIDTARTHPVLGPLPDIRRMLVPVGPVAVFGASNFPLAFSVAGGDTASALAAGCPVVVKAHPSHPGTSELAARAVQAAVGESGAPPGTFSMLQGRSAETSRALVTAPQIMAVGFTGSQRVGRLLYDLAAQRPEPIPVYAEMGSLNPVFVTPGALRTRAADIAEGYAGSMTLGNGQFCTKPGLLFVPDDDAGRSLLDRIAALVGQMSAGPLLSESIATALSRQVEASRSLPGVETLGEGRGGSARIAAAPVLLSTGYETFRARPELREEHFGPVAIGVRVAAGRYAEVAASLDGSLTGTIHAEPDEAEAVASLAAALRHRVGRLIWNGYPTGVAVVPAMQHGGPYPATTAPGHTSVGLTAVHRFLRPVAYQNAPQWLLPPQLRDQNPLSIRRLVNGVWTDAAP